MNIFWSITHRHLLFPPGNVGLCHHCFKKWIGASFLEPMFIIYIAPISNVNQIFFQIWIFSLTNKNKLGAFWCENVADVGVELMFQFSPLKLCVKCSLISYSLQISIGLRNGLVVIWHKLILRPINRFWNKRRPSHKHAVMCQYRACTGN